MFNVRVVVCIDLLLNIIPSHVGFKVRIVRHSTPGPAGDLDSQYTFKLPQKWVAKSGKKKLPAVEASPVVALRA